jgi:hypothetical protein
MYSNLPTDRKLASPLTKISYSPRLGWKRLPIEEAWPGPSRVLPPGIHSRPLGLPRLGTGKLHIGAGCRPPVRIRTGPASPARVVGNEEATGVVLRGTRSMCDTREDRERRVNGSLQPTDRRGRHRREDTAMNDRRPSRTLRSPVPAANAPALRPDVAGARNDGDRLGDTEPRRRLRREERRPPAAHHRLRAASSRCRHRLPAAATGPLARQPRAPQDDLRTRGLSGDTAGLDRTPAARRSRCRTGRCVGSVRRLGQRRRAPLISTGSRASPARSSTSSA